MKTLITNYIKDIHDGFLSSQVTDFEKSSFEFFVGVEKSVNLILNSNARGKKVIFIGNGGSAAVANHKALDFWFTGGIRGLSFSDDALLTCVSNDFGYKNVFARPISMFADSGDVIVAISSSGNSENIIFAVNEAKRLGCSVITLSGFQNDNQLRSLGDLNFYVTSKHYNKVESIHLLICDCILELIVSSRNKL